jgi:hypothetical protein
MAVLIMHYILSCVLPVSGFLGPMNWERGFDPRVFGRFDLAAFKEERQIKSKLYGR